MSNETEKITINLGVVELAQIDVLAEQGIYASRSDFIRTAIRKQLEPHRKDIEHSLTPMGSKKNWDWMVGIGGVDKAVLEECVERNEKLNISAVGLFIVPKNISAELFEKAVAKCIIRGKLKASPEIRQLIEAMNA